MKTFKKAPLALAISALMVTPLALAGGYGGNSFDTDSEINSTFDNDIDVHIENDAHTNKRINVYGGALVRDPNYSGATVDSKQLSNGNVADQTLTKNNANIGDNALQGAAGNIGANVAAGDGNQQANDAALASSDASTVFGQAASFSVQSSSNNATTVMGSPNNARMNGNALRDASGNIGVNIAAGVGNAQHNSLAASVNTASGSADATSAGVQASYGNNTTSAGQVVTLRSGSVYKENITLGGGYVGGGLGYQSGSYEGETAGISDQVGNVYLDTWNGQEHTGGSNTGHIDVDSDAQGAQAGPNGEGAFVFDETGSEEGTFSGGLGFVEAGVIGLKGTASGRSHSFNQQLVYQTNNASLSGNALANAVGNIGVNIAAGSGNMQRNSLSMASSMGGGTSGGGGGEQ
ncbi:hypothetical protein ACUN9Y_00835 [Halomonas sp. V046]|uniref:hypothetical protein n=1 Tax=Halomonas sp. V046 TaxID=3459611 RepID=UPI004044287C